MEFQTYFVITDFKFQVYLFPLGGVIFIVISLLMIKYPEKYMKMRKEITFSTPSHILEVKRKTIRGFAIAMLIFAIFWTSLTAGGLLKEQYVLRKAYLSGKFKTVEGNVHDFEPMPYSGHQDEVFSINGVTFKYSDYGVSAAFNTTRSHGGPVDEGAYLKISYVGNDIIKLEKKK